MRPSTIVLLLATAFSVVAVFYYWAVNVHECKPAADTYSCEKK